MGRPVTTGPLQGVRVIEWAIHGVGPFAGALLGELGADVIKVELPPLGDPQQAILPTIGGVGSHFLTYNTNKRSIFLDLRREKDLRTMWDLVERSDVVFSNFRAGTGEKYGLSYEEVARRNPTIVYCTCNAWGEIGPMGPTGGGDTTVQAFCGWCSITGKEGGPGEFLRFLGQLDLNASMYIVGAILTALHARLKTGRGENVQLSMLEAAIAMQSNRMSEYLTGRVLPGPLGSATSVVAPSQVFRCADGEYIGVAAETERQWQRLCRAIEHPEFLAQSDYESNAERVRNRHRLAQELSSVFASLPSYWWVNQLDRNLVPNSLFWGIDLVKYHPQVRENGHLVEVGSQHSGLFWTGGTPWKFEDTPVEVTSCVTSGADTDAILAELPTWPRPPAPHHDAGTRSLPLSGLKVIELSGGLSGPYCGSLLADNGSDVVKIEDQDGDRSRGWGPPFASGIGTAFIELNRNKHLLRFDFGREEDMQSLRGRIAGADVILFDAIDPDGSPPPISPKEMRGLNATAVLCSFSAYGEVGPYAKMPGSELVVQARSNAWAGLGKIGEEPIRLGADQASMTAGIAAYSGILAALLRRASTGRGDRVQVSSLGALLAVRGSAFTSLSHPDQWVNGNHLTAWIDPPYYGYAAADARVYVTWREGRGGAMGTGPQANRKTDDLLRFRAFIKELGGTDIPEGMDLYAGYWETASPGNSRWYGFWNDLFGKHSWRHIKEVLNRNGAEVFPFMDYQMLMHDPQVGALEMFVPMQMDDNQVSVVRVPWRLESVKGLGGYHTAEAVESYDGARRPS